MEWGHQEGKSPPQPAAWCPPSLALPLVPGNGKILFKVFSLEVLFSNTKCSK